MARINRLHILLPIVLASMFATIAVIADTTSATDSELPSEPKEQNDTLKIRGNRVAASSDIPDADVSALIPENPETGGYAPTTMDEVAPANPATGIQLIAPPVANNSGSANVAYRIEVPTARNGIAPNLQISYNSDSGSGMLGEGWDISLPSFAVDTRWGVPVYDSQFESETYTYNGVMLAIDTESTPALVHKVSETIARRDTVNFYQRRGGDFSRILRIGTSPDNYKWEVTDDNGTVYTYGTGNSVLRGSGTRQPIAEWRLASVKEVHGDICTYNYTQLCDTLYGNATSTPYIDSICVQNQESSTPHTVVRFHYSKQKKTFVSNHARYGFLAVPCSRLLDSITVNRFGELIRTYKFNYTNASFGHEVLADMSMYVPGERDAVSFHRFSYYPPEESAADSGSAMSDDESYNSSFSSSSNGGGTYVGVGGIGLGKLKDNTAGASIGFSNSKVDGKQTFLDIDGDGLSDIVYQQGDDFYYHPQIVDKGNITFGPAEAIAGLPSISTARSNSTSGGGKINVTISKLTGTVGLDRGSSTSTTDGYFSDINGDGLVDYVCGGSVYFNTLSNGKPQFSTSLPSDLSWSSDNVFENIVTDMQPTQSEQDSIAEQAPMIDAVRMWESPFSGRIEIKGDIRLANPEAEGSDGVRATIQVDSTIIKTIDIPARSADVYNYVCTTSVKRGTRVLFRLQSGAEKYSNGIADSVVWTFDIQKEATRDAKDVLQPNTRLPNGYLYGHHTQEEGLIYDCTTPLYIGNPSELKMSALFSKPETTDIVKLRVIATGATDAGGHETVWEKSYSMQESTDTVSASLTVPDSLQYLRFEIYSPTNVCWEQIHCTPVVYADSDTLAAGVHYCLYSNELKSGLPATISCIMPPDVDPQKQIYAFVTPVLSLTNSKYTGKVSVSIKSADRKLLSHTFDMQNGELGGKSFYEATGMVQGNVWAEIFLENEEELPPGIKEASVRVDFRVLTPAEAANYDATQSGTQSTEPSYKLTPSVYGRRISTSLGLMHRGWGAFVYNSGQDRYANPIDLSLLDKVGDSPDISGIDFNMDLEGDTILSDEQIVKLDSLNGSLSPNSRPVMPLSVEHTSADRFSGPDRSVYMSGTVMSASRLGMPDVVLANPLAAARTVGRAGSSRFPGVVQRSKSSATTWQLGVNMSFGDSITGSNGGITASRSSGTSETVLTTLDLNGDGYPDIVRNGKDVTYTNQQANYRPTVKNALPVKVFRSKSTNYSGGTGGEVMHAFPVDFGTKPADKAIKAANNSDTMARLGGGLSGDLSTSTTTGVSEMIDINGDGLPDIVEGNRIRLNLGYSFSEPFTMPGLEARRSTARYMACGVSPNGTMVFKNSSTSILSGSISGGQSGSLASISDKICYVDVNADGLTDKIEIAEGKISYNRGTAFTGLKTAHSTQSKKPQSQCRAISM